MKGKQAKKSVQKAMLGRKNEIKKKELNDWETKQIEQEESKAQSNKNSRRRGKPEGLETLAELRRRTIGIREIKFFRVGDLIENFITQENAMENFFAKLFSVTIFSSEINIYLHGRLVRMFFLFFTLNETKGTQKSNKYSSTPTSQLQNSSQNKIGQKKEKNAPETRRS
ncbi:CLUMA_CG020527, isoform A [Clunio marinus]|uniref:CLUMA_CG020527, isoform A n=1 Tax=Clunio marinus TaxID=568069 RepID=A0A1J1J6G5_9DIPT|nr:CLUMA_CG020527, isoform A [Clunio marinus]